MNLNLNYWKLIYQIINTSKETEIKQNMYVLERIIETYPCTRCIHHYKKYYTEYPKAICTKADLKQFMQTFQKSIRSLK